MQSHSKIIEVFGGADGVRSLALLESAVMRMQSTFDGEDLYPTLFEKAAALMESLCKNHPFIDGNKRTAFTATIAFLDVNHCDTDFEYNDTEDFVLKLATGEKTFQQIVSFLKDHSIFIHE